ncbi:hypothetical protein EDD36DRAFT_468201 [Exophiala viscosa]|uniref:BTB domain-containing protein n=2 Tax=Exophiala viscosa TaxID=2486360 RepID=A0AAN6DQ23_9EURO|nr:hypothetical protein EDD36DRAFT_468201 [Exophiala viscosa]
MADTEQSNPCASPIVTLDLHLVAGDTVTLIYIHRDILTNRSYLARWFDAYAVTNDQDIRLPISGWSPLVGLEIVHWLYRGKISFEVNTNEIKHGHVYPSVLLMKLINLYLGANRYQIDDLAAYTFDKLDAIFQSRGLDWWDLNRLTPDMSEDEGGKLQGLMIGVVADGIRKEGWLAYTTARPDFANWVVTTTKTWLVEELLRQARVCR